LGHWDRVLEASLWTLEVFDLVTYDVHGTFEVGGTFEEGYFLLG